VVPPHFTVGNWSAERPVSPLAVALPPTGPVRGLTATDIQISSQEASLAYSDPMGETILQESPDLAPEEAPAPAVTNEVK
jgi:hypothetical protein